MTVEEFATRLRAREITSEQITNECLRKIEAENSRLNAFITVLEDQARQQAREADKEIASGHDRGLLHGVPISVKDLVDIRGVPTTAASRVRDGHVAPSDAPVITHLRQAGAVIVGKTNLHEFAFGTTSEDSAYGPARNPHDPSRSPGGSSGGSAASIVTGMALATVGSDTGGSIRIPAAACGTVGLKPSFGEISLDGIVPMSRTLDHLGPLAQTVADASILYHAMLGDSGAIPPAPMPITGLRLALPRKYFCDLLDDTVRPQFEASIERLREAGARIDEIEIHHADDIVPVYFHISFADAATYHAATLESMPEKYTEAVRARLEVGRYIQAEDYVRALAGREVLRREVDAALARHDALILPTMPIVAQPIGAVNVMVGKSEQPVRGMMLRLTQLFNLTGHPALAIPMGVGSAGLPSSIQLVGCRLQTDALLRVALACESYITGVLSPRSGALGG
jgi:aspartyl-tRNA(Asn)/glutamyl-tRNA(Gln) amidotransferase subunit A